MSNRVRFITLAVIVYLFSFKCSLICKIPIRQIEVTPLLNLSEIKPKFNVISGLIISNNAFSFDMKGNIFFLDYDNHRILKFDGHGNFIKQIGNFGQGNEELYFPAGIFVNKDILYILDQEGRQLKMFSLNGDFISNFRIEGVKRSRALFVTDDLLIINVLSKREKEHKKPIALFTKNFKKLRELGKEIKTNSLAAYTTFNTAYISFHDNSIYGALRAYPVLFKYDIKGNEIFYKDLREMNIEEVLAIAKEGTEQEVDSPESLKEKNRVKSMRYCDGFGIDKKGNIYYALNYDRAKRGVILHFNPKGVLIEKIVLRIDGKQVRIERLNILKSEHYAIININKNIFLVKFKLKEEP